MTNLAVENLDQFIFGRAPNPVEVRPGLVIGGGSVVPELNFTLGTMDIDKTTWPRVLTEYEGMIEAVLKRAVELETSALLVEFETLPPMTIHPQWGLEVVRLLSERIRKYEDRYGIRGALRFTPNDTREFNRPPIMRGGAYWEGMLEAFDKAAVHGADMIAIESTGGKEVCDDALVNADLDRVVYALGVLGARDMEFLWSHIVESCRKDGIVPAGDTACGFANTAMVLAEKMMIPRVFAAVVRVASVPRSLVAYSCGAQGPSKDCAYEGPYMKALAGVPISMEGRSAACAHLSPVGNVSQCVCDCWSNESVQNVQLLSGRAPVVSLEQLAYDCRLMNTASASSAADARRLRDWLADSDVVYDPQALVLCPDVVLRIAETIATEETPYRQTRAAVQATVGEIAESHRSGRVRLSDRELKWVDIIRDQADMLPDSEDELRSRVRASIPPGSYLPEEYGLAEDA